MPIKKQHCWHKFLCWIEKVEKYKRETKWWSPSVGWHSVKSPDTNQYQSLLPQWRHLFPHLKSKHSQKVQTKIMSSDVTKGINTRLEPLPGQCHHLRQGAEAPSLLLIPFQKRWNDPTKHQFKLQPVLTGDWMCCFGIINLINHPKNYIYYYILENEAHAVELLLSAKPLKESLTTMTNILKGLQLDFQLCAHSALHNTTSKSKLT